jgi:small-conductance mechanosensitive channel
MGLSTAGRRTGVMRLVRVERMARGSLLALLLAGAAGLASAQAPAAAGADAGRTAAAAQAAGKFDRDARPPTAPAVPTTSTADLPAPDEAPFMVANRTVTVLRATFLGVPPERRARRAEAALRELRSHIGEARVTVRIEPQGHALMVNDQLVLLLVDADADRLRGQTLAQASSDARDALQRAIDETREIREMRTLLRHVGVALLATLVTAAIVIGTWWLRNRATARLAAFVLRGGAGLTLGGTQILQADRVGALVGLIVRALSWAVVLGATYQWLGLVLSQFPYTRPFGERLTGFLIGILERLGEKTLQSLPDLAVAVVIFLIARGVIAMVRPLFVRAAASSHTEGGWLDHDTARPTQRLVTVAVILFALVMAYPYLPGSDSEAFKGMSVLVGLMVTVGGSSLVSQAASGLVIMYSRTLRVGEYVRIADHEGTVMKLGAFTTRVRTGLGEELTLPNALVLGTVTKNYSRAIQGAGFIVDTVVTIGYDTPWRQVEAMLIEAARRTPGVLADPAPRVFQTGLGDFYPDYRLVCQAIPTDPRPRAELLSMLHARIQDVFNEHGVQIMSPHYLGDPATAKVVPPADWYRAPARPADAQSGPAQMPASDATRPQAPHA